MTRTRHPQLELSVLVDVNSKQAIWAPVAPATESLPQPMVSVGSSFHKPASADDQLIYKSISDNYFGISSKQA